MSVPTIDDLDLLGDALAPTRGTKGLAEAVSLAEHIQYLEGTIANQEQKLSMLREDLRRHEEELLPELMESLRLQDFKLLDGSKVEVKPFVHANIPSKSAIEKAKAEERGILEARRDAAFDWLRKHKAGDLIKNKLTILIGKGGDKDAKKLEAMAKTLKFPAEREETVHSSTLGSYIREKLEEGANLPFETFAIHTGKRAKITAPKFK